MAKEAKKASTQQHLDIENITDDLIILKTGWVALVLTTTAVNFDLLSEAEQDAAIYAYGALLNSLSFPVQILIRTKNADITTYFQNLTEAEKTQPNPDLKRQVQKYKDFIQTIVQQKTVLEKKFYVVINFSPLELGMKGLTGKKTAKNKGKNQLISDAKIALMPKRDHLIRQMGRLGLTIRQLTTQELIELVYDIYNPAPTGTQRILLDTASYTTPIVEPAVEVPIPAPQNAQESDQIAMPTQSAPVSAPIIQPASPPSPNLSSANQPSISLPAKAPSSSSLRLSESNDEVEGATAGNQFTRQSPERSRGGDGGQSATNYQVSLRPVPPPTQPQNSPEPISTPQPNVTQPIPNQINNQQSTINNQIPPSQTQALKDLQEATAKAAQLLNTLPQASSQNLTPPQQSTINLRPVPNQNNQKDQTP